MMQMERGDNSIRFQISSELYLVDKLSEEAKAFAKDLGIEDTGGLSLVLRELANNGVEHGNGSAPDKTVMIVVESIGVNRLKVVVTDQGSGFDHAGHSLRLSDDPSQERSRGLGLVNAYCDELVYNEAGNEATAYITTRTTTGFSVEREEDCAVIIPSGDITASVAEDFRALLVDLLDQGVKTFRFDLQNVMDIDSISLSIFVVFANMLRKRGVEDKILVQGANQDVQDVFLLTRLTERYAFI